MLVPRTQHQGTRPGWDCQVCGQPWPCPTAKVELSEQYRNFPAGLSLLLHSFLIEAVDDWTADASGPPSDLYERFVGWVEPAEPNGALVREAHMVKRYGVAGLLLDVIDMPVVVHIGSTLVGVGRAYLSEGRIVLEPDPDDMGAAVEQLVLDSATAAKAMATIDEDGSVEPSQRRSRAFDA
ncbi:hypothetical protein GCM10010112_82100 [Actinoplanes lobatus]|uniref:Uncharacterized protein n=1 Tax=Actinoplanes lobatus TaxID=113568 RepID=A0A7W7HLB9_9ACTN|nr:hypothetical protein [Actinoplanes lobatus]MBB4752624.1 hypothetical protein [Actinoplanes lobatus]GGN93645.1 hypothetical protein GCM10010112_82100 [Actinoplanes lobatus]GIE44711.1 hypothetical protein Alo02nite_76090 [Actinoplanes lobatus]